MSYDENRMSDLIDGGLNEKEQLIKDIDELKVKLKAIEDALLSDVEFKCPPNDRCSKICDECAVANGIKPKK